MERLTDLPDELLEAVLNQIPLATLPRNERLAPLLVCRQWTTILEPKLFHEVSLSYEDTGGSRIGAFLNYLNTKPYLRRHVHVLRLQVSKTNDWICNCVLQIFDMCTSIRELDFGMNLDPPGVPPLYLQAVRQSFLRLFRRIATMSLHTLCLSEVSFNCVTESLTSSSITELELWHPGWNDIPSSPIFQVGPLTMAQVQRDMRREMEISLPVDQFRSCKVSSLRVIDPHATPEGLSHFISWPNTLTELQLTLYSSGDYTLRFSAADLQSMLDIHAPTLQQIELGLQMFSLERVVATSAHAAGPIFPNFSHMLALTSLTISEHVAVFESIDTIVERLSAPRLRRLTLDYTTTARAGGIHALLTASVAEWLRDFCEEIARRRNAAAGPDNQDRSTSPHTGFMPEFHTIHVKIEARHHPSMWPGFTDQTWPWQWLEQADQEASVHGVHVTFDQPRWSRPVWDVIMRQFDEGELMRYDDRRRLEQRLALEAHMVAVQELREETYRADAEQYYTEITPW